MQQNVVDILGDKLNLAFFKNYLKKAIILKL